MHWIGRWAELPCACVCWQGVACRMSGDNSRASVEGRYYRAVLRGGLREPICEVLYNCLGREAFCSPTHVQLSASVAFTVGLTHTWHIL